MTDNEVNLNDMGQSVPNHDKIRLSKNSDYWDVLYLLASQFDWPRSESNSLLSSGGWSSQEIHIMMKCFCD